MSSVTNRLSKSIKFLLSKQSGDNVTAAATTTTTAAAADSIVNNKKQQQQQQHHQEQKQEQEFKFSKFWNPFFTTGTDDVTNNNTTLTETVNRQNEYNDIESTTGSIDTSTYTTTYDDVNSNNTHITSIILLIGLPGCGKTTFAHQLCQLAAKVSAQQSKVQQSKSSLLLFHNHTQNTTNTNTNNITNNSYKKHFIRINQDELMSKDKCVSIVRNIIENSYPYITQQQQQQQQKQQQQQEQQPCSNDSKPMQEGNNNNNNRIDTSIIIDRCNINFTQRYSFIKLGCEYTIPIDCIVFDTSIKTCIERLYQRKYHPTLSLYHPNNRSLRFDNYYYESFNNDNRERSIFTESTTHPESSRISTTASTNRNTMTSTGTSTSADQTVASRMSQLLTARFTGSSSSTGNSNNSNNNNNNDKKNNNITSSTSFIHQNYLNPKSQLPKKIVLFYKKKVDYVVQQWASRVGYPKKYFLMLREQKLQKELIQKQTQRQKQIQPQTTQQEKRELDNETIYYNSNSNTTEQYYTTMNDIEYCDDNDATKMTSTSTSTMMNDYYDFNVSDGEEEAEEEEDHDDKSVTNSNNNIGTNTHTNNNTSTSTSTSTDNNSNNFYENGDSSFNNGDGSFKKLRANESDYIRNMYIISNKDDYNIVLHKLFIPTTKPLSTVVTQTPTQQQTVTTQETTTGST